MKKFYQLVIFTSSEQEYADAILDIIDPKRKLFATRLYRDSCTYTRDGYIKDLEIITNRTLNEMALVDNNIFAGTLQLDNFIPVADFKGDKSDKEL